MSCGGFQQLASIFLSLFPQSVLFHFQFVCFSFWRENCIRVFVSVSMCVAYCLLVYNLCSSHSETRYRTPYHIINYDTNTPHKNKYAKLFSLACTRRRGSQFGVSSYPALWLHFFFSYSTNSLFQHVPDCVYSL